MERRRLEREREKTERTKLSSPKRIPETSVIPDEVSDHEDFEPWEDVEETQNSPRSDVTVSRVGFRVKVLPAVETRNSWFWRNTLPLRSRGVVYQTEKRWTDVVTVLFHCWFRVQAQKCDHLSSPFLLNNKQMPSTFVVKIKWHAYRSLNLRNTCFGSCFTALDNSCAM